MSVVEQFWFIFLMKDYTLDNWHLVYMPVDFRGVSWGALGASAPRVTKGAQKKKKKKERKWKKRGKQRERKVKRKKKINQHDEQGAIQEKLWEDNFMCAKLLDTPCIWTVLIIIALFK